MNARFQIAEDVGQCVKGSKFVTAQCEIKIAHGGTGEKIRAFVGQNKTGVALDPMHRERQVNVIEVGQYLRIAVSQRPPHEFITKPGIMRALVKVVMGMLGTVLGKRLGG
jgi:hypothetical protein